VQQLVHHWDLQPDQRKAAFARSAALAHAYLAGGQQAAAASQAAQGEQAAAMPTVRELALLLARLACNCHTIADEVRGAGAGRGSGRGKWR
jgi:hypothetical protein